jgi:hypothetical protein
VPVLLTAQRGDECFRTGTERRLECKEPGHNEEHIAWLYNLLAGKTAAVNVPEGMGDEGDEEGVVKWMDDPQHGLV